MTSDSPCSTAILQVRELDKIYRISRLSRGEKREIHAVKKVSFDVGAGETLAIVGESGSGKSSVANSVLQLDPPTSGSVRFLGQELTGLSSRDLKAVRRNMQVIFQDPYASLDSRIRIGEIVAEPLRIHFPRMKSAERLRKVEELFDLVGLGAMGLDRYPHQLSGGQRQRIGIARALILEPQLLVCDEAVSALDVSIQAQVLNLLSDLQTKLQLAYLFITHDLGVVRQIADRIAVMYQGEILEYGLASQILDHPQNSYTRALINAVPGRGNEARETARQSLRERDADLQ